jgi:hypothetical protein
MENVYHDTDQTQVFINVQNRYFGIPGNQVEFANAIYADMDVGQFGRVGFTLTAVRPLQDRAQALSGAGQSRLLATIFSQPFPEDADANENPLLNPFDGHLENIDTRAFAELNLANIPIEESRIIGDRNWVNGQGEACHLGIRRVNNEVYTFVTITAGEADSGPLQGWMALSPVE